MKNLPRWSCALLAALLMPAVACAAVDMYLKIEGVKGEKRVVHCPNGACIVTDLPPGQYSVLVCDAQGNVISSEVTLTARVFSPRDPASGQATGKRARDVSSGQASGKRTHHPIKISAASTGGGGGGTGGSTAPNEIAIDEPGVHLAIGVSADVVDAAVAAAEAQRATKTRSNIQNN